MAPNLTPDPETGAGNWTDDQIARAVREGIGHDGRALFPIMAYRRFRSMGDEDLASIVVFLRSLPPVYHALPKTEIIFPVKYLIRGAPQPLTTAVSRPDPSDRVARGHYMATIGGYEDCHTAQERGKDIANMNFAGGFFLGLSGGQTAAAANITPVVGELATTTSPCF